MQESISRQIENIASKSKTDDIFIVGKGPSIDEISGASLSSGLTINLNDSEIVRVGDIGVFSANWVRRSLADKGFRCQFYLAGKPLPKDVPHEVLPPLPMELDGDELSVHRLLQPTFYDESLVLLNALKVCLKLSEIRGRTQNVYLLGLDFTTQGGALSSKVTHDFASSPIEEREANVHSQFHHYVQFQRFTNSDRRLRLFHVGHREFSKLTPSDFLRKFDQSGDSKTVQISRKETDKVQIVAELTNNHLGDASRLTEMVRRAKDAGADLIKVQKRDVDTFYPKDQLKSHYWSPFGNTLEDYRKGVELNDELLNLLDECCRENEIEWFCSVLDYPSFEVISRFNPTLLKIPSTISNHRDFHRRLAANYSGAIVVSTGATESEYEDYILKTFSGNERLYLLHCVSAYPTSRDACNIAVIQHYAHLAKTNPKIIPGYSSHDLGSLGCMLAVSAGAKIIEKHVKLGDVDWIHFDKVAIDLKTTEFANFVKDIREAERILGSPMKRIQSSEHHKYVPNIQ